MANQNKNSRPVIVNVMSACGSTIPLQVTEAESNLIENDEELLQKIIRERGPGSKQDGPSGSDAGDMDSGAQADNDTPVIKGEDCQVWTPPRVRTLIALYKEHAHRFVSAHRKRDVWQLITEELNAACGTNFGADEGDRKWRNLKSRYMIILETLKETGYARNKMWMYFSEVEDAINSNPEAQPTARYHRLKPNERVSAASSPSPPSSPEASSPKHSDAPAWFLAMFHEFEERSARRHEEHIRVLRKHRKTEKKRNKLLKQIVEKMTPYLDDPKS
ncbi:uncharacterized protein LOC101853847 [Aplysia californica]|uniref:Uncharacterized protein LOC101853847 n=1 Tax=Aplysia californica TaxID=6500 RepID=A0ABM0JJP0_APLCA|nr:uncharacterized protein LOC101853847 [Aplysia californica]